MFDTMTVASSDNLRECSFLFVYVLWLLCRRMLFRFTLLGLILLRFTLLELMLFKLAGVAEYRLPVYDAQAIHYDLHHKIEYRRAQQP